jgi:uncharacterized protein YbjT (DUF2867 family)
MKKWGERMKILVTGATGQLGSALLRQLKDSDYEVKLTSRRKPENIGDINWVYSDLLSGEGLEEAIKDIDVVIHAATSPMKNSEIIDVTGFGKFLDKLENIKHFIYPSIVGIEDIPMKYYKHKLEAEALLKNSAVPYSIVRATQFHSFVESLLLSKPLFNRYIIPGNMKFQSVDVDEFANHLTSLIDLEPQGKIDDFGGPQIMTLREMAEQKIKINNEKNKVFSFSLPGNLYRALVEGKNTNTDQRKGKVTFENYLIHKKDQG